MTQQLIIMSLAVFGASALQAATGIGFGVVAGPILLAMMNSADAIQISILMNLLIAVLLAPSLKANVDWRLLKRLLAGSVVGLPLGVLVFLTVSIAALKILAAIAVLLALAVLLRSLLASLRQPVDTQGRGAEPPQPKTFGSVFMGFISGLMGGALAMPGPVPAGWMSAIGFGKDHVRGTILMLFVFSYAAALGLQFALAGISMATAWISLSLVPAVLVGIMTGKALTRFISERVFSWLVAATLVMTAGLLAVSIF